MVNKKEIIIDWLNDAYLMEQTAYKIFDGYYLDAEEYLDIFRLIENQKKQTKSQANRVREEIIRLGGEPLELEESRELIDFTSPFQSTAQNMDRDRVIKNIITEHAIEHFNHLSYKVLAEAARYLGEVETANLCDEIMLEDEEMAKEIENTSTIIVRQFLDRAS